MSVVTEALPLAEVYYSHTTGKYWRLDARGRWISINEETAKKLLVAHGYRKRALETESLAEVDVKLLEIQSEQNVDYAGPLAGYLAGKYDINGRPILVTESPVLITSAPGDWPILRQVLEGMLQDPVHDQLPYFYGWLKKSLEAYTTHRWQPGQVVAFAGPVGSGKSLLQSIITELFGGRSASPYQFMIGDTTFNSDHFRAEHQMVEDDHESTDYRSRRAFGAAIKKLAVNRNHRCHGKQKEALELSPIWRMTISLNDTPERLQVLPPIDPDIADKIMLFKVQARPMPMPTTTAEQIRIFRQTISSELPAFVAFLEAYEIPETIKSERFGVAAYHHPDLLQTLDEFTPELRLLEFIDKVYFIGGLRAEPIHAPATDIEVRLTADSSSVKREAKALFSYNTACGGYLSKLSVKRPERVSRRTVHGQARYTIQPPTQNDRLCLSPLGGGVEGLNNLLGINGNSNREQTIVSSEKPCQPLNPSTRSGIPKPHLPETDATTGNVAEEEMEPITVRGTLMADERKEAPTTNIEEAPVNDATGQNEPAHS